MVPEEGHPEGVVVFEASPEAPALGFAELRGVVALCIVQYFRRAIGRWSRRTRAEGIPQEIGGRALDGGGRYERKWGKTGFAGRTLAWWSARSVWVLWWYGEDVAIRTCGRAGHIIVHGTRGPST